MCISHSKTGTLPNLQDYPIFRTTLQPLTGRRCSCSTLSQRHASFPMLSLTAVPSSPVSEEVNGNWLCYFLMPWWMPGWRRMRFPTAERQVLVHRRYSGSMPWCYCRPWGSPDLQSAWECGDWPNATNWPCLGFYAKHYIISNPFNILFLVMGKRLQLELRHLMFFPFQWVTGLGQSHFCTWGRCASTGQLHVGRKKR